MNRAFLALVLSSVSCFTTECVAGLLRQPTGVVASNVRAGFHPVTVLIDQSNLSSFYDSGVTDFDTYIASAPTHRGLASVWATDNNVTTATLDFDLGGAFPIDGLVLWNRGFNFANQIGDFQLLADDNSAFSSPVVLGNFSANGNLGTNGATGAEVFSFTQTNASHFRMDITSAFGGGSAVLLSAGEVAFRQPTAVPEPSSFLGLGLVSVMAAGFNWCKKRRASVAQLSQV